MLVFALPLIGCTNVEEGAAEEMASAPRDFATAYSSGLGDIMMLEFCGPAKDVEGSSVMSDWWTLNVRAHRLGLTEEILAAQEGHRNSLAQVRLNTTCPEGLGAAVSKSELAVERLSALLDDLEGTD